jgi:hypothetical protein
LQSIHPSVVVAALAAWEEETPFPPVRKQAKRYPLMERIFKQLAIPLQGSTDALYFYEKARPLSRTAKGEIHTSSTTGVLWHNLFRIAVVPAKRSQQWHYDAEGNGSFVRISAAHEALLYPPYEFFH